MSSIATCPQCAAQFALPALAAGDYRARCPDCQGEFAVAEAQRHEPSVVQGPTPAPLDGFSPEFRSAETVAFSSTTLTGWEERLKRAIESTAGDSNGDVPPNSFSSRTTVLEGSPEFDFHLDPPEESPTESISAVPVKLPDTHEWFNGEHVVAHGREGEAPAEPGVAKGDAGGSAAAVFDAGRAASPTRRPRRRSAFLKHAAVAFVFGAVGVVLGQYALLWLRGPNADYMQLAQVLPDSLRPSLPLPRDFGQPVVIRPRVEPDSEPRETSPVETITRQLAESRPLEHESGPLTAPPLVRDDAVEPAAAELTPPLLPATNTTTDEFAELVAAARSAVPALLSGDLKSLESSRAKGHAYMALCRLAEKFDFTSDLTLGPEAEREAARARALFRTTAATAASQADFAFIVGKWWEHDQRPTPGIFLVGHVESVEPVAKRTLYRVAIEDAKRTTLIPVLAEHADFQPGDPIGVVGTIVAIPRRALGDFPLNLPQLAVAQDCFAVALD